MTLHTLNSQNTVLNKFIAQIRDKSIQTDSMRFRRNLERIGEITAYEISKELSYTPAWVFAAIGMSVVGAVLLSLGNVDFTVENSALGMVSACVSVFSYGGYIVGVRKSRAVEIDSAVLTCYVMGLGALYFILGGLLTGGVRIETDGMTWLCILGLALPATALSNMTLVQAIKRIGPTLTSIFGALEPLTAVVIGVAVFGEPFTAQGAAGILLIVAAVSVVVLRTGRRPQ